jgi:threonyl-tRNA synthetase
VGEKEMTANTLSIRTRSGGELGAIPVPEVIERLKRANAEHGNF